MDLTHECTRKISERLKRDSTKLRVCLMHNVSERMSWIISEFGETTELSCWIAECLEDVFEHKSWIAQAFSNITA